MTPPTDNVRSLAAWVVDQTLASRRPLDSFLRHAERGLPERDRRLLRELTLGTLRWLRRLDHVIQAAGSRGLGSIDRPLLAPLRLGIYQLLMLDRIPAHAAVDESVAEARRRTHRGGAAFVNAVLRRVSARPALEAWPVREPDPVRRLAVETSHPDFLVERWWRRFGEARTRGLLEANNRLKPLHLLTFRHRGGRETVARRLAREGVSTEPSQLAPQGLIVTSGDPLRTRAFREGEIYVQDAASQAAALIPPPGPGERVLDLTAAPGGKSFSLLAVEPGLELVAADLAPERVGTLQANVSRLRLQLNLVVADALRPSWRSVFDRVLVDLPCSGTGTLRQHPELKWRVSPAEIERLGAQGRELVRAGVEAVAAGGLLVIVTCSLEAEENADLVSGFLADSPDFELVPLAEQLDRPLAAGVIGPGFWQVLTARDHDGFTVQVARRRL